MIDALLAGYRWYRKWRGGLWFYVYPRPMPYMQYWTRAPVRIETIIRMELHE